MFRAVIRLFCCSWSLPRRLAGVEPHSQFASSRQRAVTHWRDSWTRDDSAAETWCVTHTRSFSWFCIATTSGVAPWQSRWFYENHPFKQSMPLCGGATGCSIGWRLPQMCHKLFHNLASWPQLVKSQKWHEETCFFIISKYDAFLQLLYWLDEILQNTTFSLEEIYGNTNNV